MYDQQNIDFIIRRLQHPGKRWTLDDLEAERDLAAD